MAFANEALQPAEFAATAARAAAACHGLGLREQARRLADDGLLGVMAPEDIGGLHLPLDFAVPIVAAGNAGLLGLPLLETMLAGRVLQPALPRVAEAVISGTTLATMAWQGSAEMERKGGAVVLSGWLGRVPCAADADGVLLRVGLSSAAWVPTGAEGVVIEEAAGLDLTVPEHTIHLQHVVIPAANIFGEGTWKTLVSDANVLRAAAILGSAETCLSVAQEHASTRRQFGHALSYNQAIRHHLARQKLALEGMRHAITRSLGADAGARERDVAFLAASTYGSAIGEGAIQVHGGMGFTWDVPVHRHLRRIRSLQAQGDAACLIAALGRRYVEAVAPASETAS